MLQYFQVLTMEIGRKKTQYIENEKARIANIYNEIPLDNLNA